MPVDIETRTVQHTRGPWEFGYRTYGDGRIVPNMRLADSGKVEKPTMKMRDGWENTSGDVNIWEDV